MLTVTFTCNDPTQLAAEVDVLHRVLSGHSFTTAAPISTAPVVDNDAQPKQTETAPPPPAAIKPRGRKGKNNVPESAKDPERPDILNRIENDFLVYNSDGQMRAGFSHASHATKLIAQLASAITEVEELDHFAAANEATLQRMDKADADAAYSAIEAQYANLGAPPTADDGNDPEDISFDDLKAAARAFAEEIGGSNGVQAMMNLLAEFKIGGLGEIRDKPAQFPAVMKRITEIRAELKAGKPAKKPDPAKDIFG